MRYARVENGLVIEIIETSDEVSISDVVHPLIASACHPCGSEVDQGWIFDGSGFAAVPAATPSAAELTAYAAHRRWRVEVGGITVAGIPVLTDDRSKLMIAGARLAAMADPGWTTLWHGADGGIYPLDAAAIVEISDAVSAHVQATFATFAEVKGDIASGNITATAEIDAAFA